MLGNWFSKQTTTTTTANDEHIGAVSHTSSSINVQTVFNTVGSGVQESIGRCGDLADVWNDELITNDVSQPPLSVKELHTNRLRTRPEQTSWLRRRDKPIIGGVIKPLYGVLMKWRLFQCGGFSLEYQPSVTSSHDFSTCFFLFFSFNTFWQLSFSSLYL